MQTKLLSHLQKIRDIREIERAQEAMMNDLENEDSFEVLTQMEGECSINNENLETEFKRKEFWILF